jgi:hypothetical protein
MYIATAFGHAEIICACYSDMHRGANPACIAEYP